jgi:hypothetical protein
MSLKNQSWNKSFFGAGSGYGDNWDPTKNPISIGFVPGYALQSRELLELQTILAYQTSTSNRCLFKHGQPRIDLETEDISSLDKSPITYERVNNPFAEGNLIVYKNAEFFTNFTTPPNIGSWIPTGFWVTFPPYLTDLESLEFAIPSLSVNQWVGFEIEIRVVSGDGTETDQFGNIYDFRDPAGREYANSQAVGAGRLVYEIVNQGTTDAPIPLVTSPIRNPELVREASNDSLRGFVPIAKKQAQNVFVFAYDDEITVPTP